MIIQFGQNLQIRRGADNGVGSKEAADNLCHGLSAVLFD